MYINCILIYASLEFNVCTYTWLYLFIWCIKQGSKIDQISSQLESKTND